MSRRIYEPYVARRPRPWSQGRSPPHPAPLRLWACMAHARRTAPEESSNVPRYLEIVNDVEPRDPRHHIFVVTFGSARGGESPTRLLRTTVQAVPLWSCHTFGCCFATFAGFAAASAGRRGIQGNPSCTRP